MNAGLTVYVVVVIPPLAVTGRRRGGDMSIILEIIFALLMRNGRPLLPG